MVTSACALLESVIGEIACAELTARPSGVPAVIATT